MLFFLQNSPIAAGTELVKRNFKTQLIFTFGATLNKVNTEFHDAYSEMLGGNPNQFGYTPIIGGATKSEFIKGYRFGVSVEFFNNSFSDYYLDTVKQPDLLIYRQISGELTSSNIPVFLTAEYKPYHGQFRTFIGGAIGGSFSNIEWSERVFSDKPYDKRYGGPLYKGLDFSPAIRFYIGVELGFDREWNKRLLHALIVELRHTYFFGSVNLFENLGKQLYEVPPGLNDGYNIVPPYISINVSLSLNFNYKKKKK